MKHERIIELQAVVVKVLSWGAVCGVLACSEDYRSSANYRTKTVKNVESVDSVDSVDDEKKDEGGFSRSSEYVNDQNSRVGGSAGDTSLYPGPGLDADKGSSVADSPSNDGLIDNDGSQDEDDESQVENDGQSSGDGDQVTTTDDPSVQEEKLFMQSCGEAASDSGHSGRALVDALFEYFNVSTCEGLLAQAFTTADIALQNKGITDIELIGFMPELQSVTLSGNAIDNLSALTRLKYLHTIDLRNNGLQSISGLNTGTAIKYLDLSDNSLETLNGIEGLGSLQELRASNNVLVDLTAVEGLIELRKLWLDNNRLESAHLYPLNNLTKLEFLDLSNNNIDDLSYIQDLIDRGSVELIVAGNPLVSEENPTQDSGGGGNFLDKSWGGLEDGGGAVIDFGEDLFIDDIGGLF